MAEQSPNWVNLCLTDVRKWFSDTITSFESMIPMLFNTDTSDRQEEYDMTYTGLGNWKRFDGAAVKDSMTEEYKKTYDFPEWMNSIDIRRKLWDDKRDRSVMNMAKELALSFNRTKEAHAAEIFNYAFTATGTYSGGGSTKGPDGKALCANDHPSTADGAYRGDNLSTEAFSAAAVETDRQEFRKLTDGRGNRIYAKMDMLLVPGALEEQAWEIINSKGKVDTADNNANFHKGRYKLAVWDELTDPENWFSIDSERMKMYLWWITRIPVENWKEFDNQTQTLTFGGYARYGLGYSSWRWLIGHNVG